MNAEYVRRLRRAIAYLHAAMAEVNEVAREYSPRGPVGKNLHLAVSRAGGAAFWIAQIEGVGAKRLMGGDALASWDESVEEKEEANGNEGTEGGAAP